MSKDYYQQALGGTRETAQDAIQKITTDIERYGNSGHKDARKHQIIFTCNVLSGICRNCEKMQLNAHFDIYVDIYTLVLAPKLQPNASPVHWKRLLYLLDYLFLMLARYKFHTTANQLHAYLTKIQLKWEDFDDLKYLLSIHGSQIQLFLMHHQTEMNAVAIIGETLQALEILFINTKDRLRVHPINSKILLSEFMNSVITNRSSFQMQLATKVQSAQLEPMYKSFFELLAASLDSDTTDPEANFIEHLQAFYKFMQMDIHGRLQQQIALHYAHVLCGASLFRQNEFIGYCCCLLKNLLKFAYVRVRIGNFKDAYTQVCNKLCGFFTHRGKVLMQHDWFQHFFAVIFRLLTPMHTPASGIFDMFWQQMDRDLYISHVKLIAELEILTPLARKTNLVQFDCCKNPNSWFHFQLKYAENALEAYSQLLKKYKEENTSEAVRTEISNMLSNSIDTLIEMEHECSKSAYAIRKLCVTIATLLQEANHSAHASDLLYLATKMTRLKSRIIPEDWRMIMQRVNKTAAICGDKNVATEILACYIADLICTSSEPDFMILNNFMQFHHYNASGTSLFKIYSQSTSEFKQLLQKHEKRFFQWLEAQYVFKVYDKEKHHELYMIIAKHSQTKYDFINAVHAGKLLDHNSILTKVKNMYEMLKGSSALSRFQELTLAHTICLLLFKRCEELKVIMATNDFQESNLMQLFEEKSLLSLCANKEMEMINMALSAVHAFDGFFKRSDTEPLDSNDGWFLDWSRILEDLVSLAMYLQTAGYLDYASEAWLLHYRIASTIDDEQSSFRSLAFLCEYNTLFENDERLQLSKEIDKNIEYLIHALENLPQLLRRQQNFTLTCVCQIAYYHACQRKYDESHNLLQLVHHCHKLKLDGRNNKYDIVLFTADVVQFRIQMRHKPPAEFFGSKTMPKAATSTPTPNEDQDEDVCLLHQIDLILNRIRSFVHISSADRQPYILLLLSMIDDFADVAVNRLCDNFLSGFLSVALKSTVEAGLAMRTAQLLSKWVLINLQMEFLQKAEIKMQMIESILGLRDAKELHDSLKQAKSCAVTVSKQLQNEHEFGTLSTGLEEVRKVAVASSLSLIQEKMYKPSMTLDHKLENCHNKKAIGKSSQLSNIALWGRLTLSLLRARFNFLYRDYSSLNVFYENCEKWLGERKQTIYFKIFQSTVLMYMVHYGNFLRENKDYDKAMEHLEMCIEHCSSLEGKVDGAYRVHFQLQLDDTNEERYEYRTRILTPRKKMPLSVMFKLNAIEKTPIGKSIKYAQVGKTSSIKKPPSNNTFVIFSDRKSPRQSHFIQKNQPIAMKGLSFSQSSSEGSGSSGSESSAERKSKKKPNLDSCQIIELSDSDCDVEVYKPTKTASDDKKKEMERTKPKLIFTDSVELEDFHLISTKTATTEKIIGKIERSKKCKDVTSGIVNKMQNLSLVSTPTTSNVNVAIAAVMEQHSSLISSPTIKAAQSAVPTIKIDRSENSQGPKKRTKRIKDIKTPETATAENASTPIVPTRMTRLRARQKSATSRDENSPETSSTMSVQRRHRN